MPGALPLLANVTAASGLESGGFSWWQTIGGLLAVFGLLLLSLKLLGRWNRRRPGAEAGLLAVWPLGPKREIQVLRLAEEVHYIYRHDNAMVLLKQDTLANYSAQRETVAPTAEGPRWKRFLPDGLPFPRRIDPSGASAPDLTSF